MTPIEKLLLDLIKIPSVSGQEREIGNFLVSQLNGFKIRKQYVDKERFNVIAQKGKSNIWIVAHMDTVPGNVPIKMTKDKIYGRGAVDNKASIAGAIMAGRRLKDINLLFTVDEEAEFAGAKKAKIRNRKFIVMEPTNFEIMTGQRGAIAFRIIAKGKQMHSSLEFKKESSAVYNLTNVLSKLYEKKWTAFNVIISNGGEKDSVVPGYAEAKAFVRPKTEQEYKAIIGYLKNLKDQNIRITIDGKFPPSRSSLLDNKKTVPYFSEMAFFKNSLLFGAGDIKLAHSENEYVLRNDLNNLEGKLTGLIRKLEK
jgi:acetylornithine deacetylase/succinyl-diaminopimelate desuccinylase-like protein